MNELINIERSNALDIFTKPNEIDSILLLIEKEAKSLIADVKTKSGRDSLRKNAANVAKAKAEIERAGKELADKQKEIPKLIDASRKKAREFLENLQADVRKPLTDYEKAESDRIESLLNRVSEITSSGLYLEELSSDQIQIRLDTVKNVQLGDDWEEKLTDAALAKDAAIGRLTIAYESKKKEEEDEKLRIELENKAKEELRLKLEAEEKERIEREKKEAIEAAIKQAEKKAKAEAESVRIKAEKDMLESIRLTQEAARKIAESEAKAKAAEEELKQKLLNEKIQKENELRIKAEKQAELLRIEKLKQEAEKKELEEIERKKLKDKEHKRKIHNEIFNKLILITDEETSKKIIEAIARKQIEHLSINY